MNNLLRLVLVTLTLGWVAAHPGGHDLREAAARREFLQHSRRDLRHCAEKLHQNGYAERQKTRRQELVRRLRVSTGLETRDLSDIDKSHHSEGGYSLNTPAEVLFSSNKSCVLSPEATAGPYYVTGEFVRRDIFENEPGVPLFVDTQVIDVETCNPVPDVFVEIWHANATGVYSGIIAEGNGDSNDTTNIDKTFLRGVQKTDPDGITTFETIFPGHYTSRATHIHVMIHLNASVFPNGTIVDTTASHVGQIFFDQDLIHEVDAVQPYTENEQEMTLNKDDRVLVQEAETSDPFVEYVYLDEDRDVTSGLLAWLAFGVDRTAVQDVTAASFYYEQGGVENPEATDS